MGSFFSKKKHPSPSHQFNPPQSQITEQDKAILKLKNMRDQLNQYRKRCELQLVKERELAIRLIKENKTDRAKLLLKKKRFLEGRIADAVSQIDNLEQQVNSIEFAVLETQMALSMQRGNEALKAIHSVMSREDVERIMDESRDSIAYQQEIDSLISTKWTQQDESQLEAELDTLVQSEMAEQLPDVPATEPEAPAAADTAASTASASAPTTRTSQKAAAAPAPAQTRQRVAVPAT